MNDKYNNPGVVEELQNWGVDWDAEDNYKSLQEASQEIIEKTYR